MGPTHPYRLARTLELRRRLSGPNTEVMRQGRRKHRIQLKQPLHPGPRSFIGIGVTERAPQWKYMSERLKTNSGTWLVLIHALTGVHAVEPYI